MTAVHYTTETALVVADICIPEDSQGRYNLNILHRASGNEDVKRPTDWLRRKSTKALIAELHNQSVNLHSDVVAIVNGGDHQGTYAHQLLAVSYAGWISPAFQLKVNQAFLDMKEGRLAPVSATPTVHDPALKMLIDMALKLDESRYEVACIKEEQFRHTQALVAQQQQTIKALSTSQRAESKADMLIDAHRMTVQEFIVKNGLLRQFPEGQWSAISRWCRQFCELHILEYIPVPVAGRRWEDENSYPIEALMAWNRQATRNIQHAFHLIPKQEA